MLWKLFSAVTLVNFGGREIDQSALVRYLTEAVYFPTALLPSRTLRWEELDSDSARATLVRSLSCQRHPRLCSRERIWRPRQTVC